MEYLNCLNFGSTDRSQRRKYDAVDQMKKKRKMMVEIVVVEIKVEELITVEVFSFQGLLEYFQVN